MDRPEPTNEDVQRLYGTVLYCFRHPSGHRGMDDFTERSLASFHRELEKRGLPKDHTDDTNPDPFAGYSSIMVQGPHAHIRLADLLNADGMKAILDFAYLVRTNKASIDGVGEVLRPFFPNVEDPSILGRKIVEAIEVYHKGSEASLREHVKMPPR